PPVGTISASGLYTAPSSIASAQSVTVTATSSADSTKSASATVNLAPPVTVLVTPSSATLKPTQSQSLTATVSGTSNTGVTWTLNPQVGGLASSGNTAVYTAPGTISNNQSVTISASSMQDPTKAANVLLALVQAIAVSLSPSAVTLTPGGTQQFTATVTGTSNTGVNWSLNPAVGSIDANGLYTAPSTLTSSTTVTVTATSADDNTRSASATITLNPPVIQTLATFQLSEMFGASWPDQPIEFRYDGGLPQPDSSRMIGPDGAETPFQWVSSCSDATATKGCILVR